MTKAAAVMETRKTTSFAEGEVALDDVLGYYLRDIGRFPLLTPAEETELAAVMAAGKLAAERLEQPLDPQSAADAFQCRQRGDEARRRMVECNLRLVVSIARRYSGRGLPLADLVEEGNLGLMRATDKFDPARGYRFSTYAVWWIRQAVTRALDSQSRTVRLPGHVVERLNHAAKATNKLAQELGREPRSEEIARELGIAVYKVQEALKAAQAPVSLERPHGEGGDLSIADVVEDTQWGTHAAEVSGESRRGNVLDALRDLSEREQRVIALRYGLGGEHRCTLEEAGRVLGVTRERVRQIEKETLVKLRRAGADDAVERDLQEVA